MSRLQDILKAEMAREVAISFARFMELALYCPKIGYYERADVSPGRRGDFYTSASVGELFGELLANQFEDWGATRNAQWQIVEAGAHDGNLAEVILNWLRKEREESFATLEYWIIEPSVARREMQEKKLAAFVNVVRWFASWKEIPVSGVNGVIFSNELLDAMPVHRVGWDAAKKEWFEWGVTLRGQNFGWTKMSTDYSRPFDSALRASDGAFAGLPPELLSVLPNEFTTEICPAALDWWRQAARALKSGRLMTLDYGLRAEQFFTPERKNGTLRAYHRQHFSGDLLANPGEQDITAHVNFTAIQSAGEAEGLRTESFNAQRQFLTAIIEKNCCDNPSVKEWTPSRVRQFQTLTHPEHLGEAFKVLVQTRERH